MLLLFLVDISVFLLLLLFFFFVVIVNDGTCGGQVFD